MRNIYKIVVMVLFAASVGGCVTPPSPSLPQHLVEAVSKYKEGKTTYSEVIGELGSPQGAALLGNGRKTIMYIDGLYLGYGLVNKVEMLFDEKDVLVSKMNTKG